MNNTEEEFEQDLLRQAKKENIRALASNDALEAQKHEDQASKIKAIAKRFFGMKGKVEHANLIIKGGCHHE